MGAPVWPPTLVELVPDLDAVRAGGLDVIAKRELPALARACKRLGQTFDTGDPDVEGLLRSAVDALAATEPGRAARLMFGIGQDERSLSMEAREGLAGEQFGIRQRQFQRTRRTQVLNAVAQQILRMMSAASSPDDGQAGYRSPMRSWDEKAWVRAGSRQTYPFEPDLDFFPRSLVPILATSEAQALSEDQVQEILVLWLYNYLHFTVVLEVGPVNEVCQRISSAAFMDWLPNRLKEDALKIYTDEGGHAQMSKELSRSVQEFTALRPVTGHPQFLTDLDRLKRNRLPFQSEFVTLLFVMVSETLITGSLNAIPGDTSVQRAVRDVAKDHAADESRHHSFFTQLLKIIWPRLNPVLRQEAVLLLPGLLRAFLDVDQGAVRRILQRYPIVFPEPGRTMTELVGSQSVERGLQASAKPTLTLFGRVGVFDEPGAIESFERNGFIVEPAA